MKKTELLSIMAERGQQAAADARRRTASREQDAVALLSRVIAQCHAPTNAAGVYLLFDEDDRVVYVGQAERVLVRMGGHHNKDFAHAKMIEVNSRPRRLQIERRLIEILRPPLNVMLVPASGEQP